MATIASLSADVFSLTKRPDKDAETKVAIKAATLKAHQQDFFDRDLLEAGFAFTDSAFLQTFDYSTLVPRWRAAKYFRKMSGGTATDVPVGSFKILTPDALFDAYGCQKQDVAYLAGEVFQFRSSTSFQYMLAGYYVNPELGDSNYSSWAANQHPYAIVYEAAAAIFKSIGADSEAQFYGALAASQMASILTANILATGS